MSVPGWLSRSSEAQEFYSSERCYILELFNEPSAPEFSLALARVLSGTTTQLHALTGVEETYIIKKGCGLMEVEGVSHTVSAGDRVIIRAGQSQRITNTEAIDLEFYCICRPRFTPDCYVDIETKPTG